MASKYKSEQDVRSQIEHEVKNGKNETEFLVVDSMPGFGKTYHITTAIIDICTTNPSRKMLVVVPFGPSHPNASQIANDINFNLGYEAAIYVGQHNYLSLSLSLKILSTQVVIITHRRYIDICNSSKRMGNVLVGRDTLIIDEKIVFSSMVQLTTNDLKRIIAFAPSSKFNEIKMITGEMLDLINESKGTSIVRNASALLNGIANVTEQVKKVYTEEHVAEMKIIGIKNCPSPDVYLELFERLQHFYNQGMIIVDGSPGTEGTIFTMKEFKPILLKNNIMLTGSARTLIPFDFSPYVKMNTPHFGTFSHWTMHVDNHRSGTMYANSYRKDLIQRYFDLISQIAQPGDEILVVSSNKIELDEMEKELLGFPGVKFHFTTYHNNVGTNNYSNCNKIVLMSLPKISNYQAIIDYQAFENPSLTELIWSLYNGYYIDHEAIKNGIALFDLNKTSSIRWSNPNMISSNQVVPKYAPKITRNLVQNYQVKNYHSFCGQQFNLKNQRALKDVDLEVRKIDGVFKIRNPRIRAYKIALMTEILLQTVLRINRAQKLNADVYMVNKDADVINCHPAN